MDMIEVVILLVRDPLFNLTEPHNWIGYSCRGVDYLSLSRVSTQYSRL